MGEGKCVTLQCSSSLSPFVLISARYLINQTLNRTAMYVFQHLLRTCVPLRSFHILVLRVRRGYWEAAAFVPQDSWAILSHLHSGPCPKPISCGEKPVKKVFTLDNGPDLLLLLKTYMLIFQAFQSLFIIQCGLKFPYNLKLLKWNALFFETV